MRKLFDQFEELSVKSHPKYWKRYLTLMPALGLSRQPRSGLTVESS